MLQMITGGWVAQMISVAAKVGIADALSDGPRTSEEIAQAVSAHPPSLYRLMRSLASFGIFSEDESGNFELTPMGELLRSNVEGSMRAMAIMNGEDWCRKSWTNLLYSIQTGDNAFKHVLGMSTFEYFAQNKEAGAIFDATMTNVTRANLGAVLDAYDFSAFDTVVDVGGREGLLIAGILKREPSVKGILFDLPHAAERAAAYLKEEGLASRCEAVSGDFFKSVPEGGDVYLLKRVIIEWDDDNALKILKSCHKAMASTARILLLDPIMPPRNAPGFGKILDIEMLLKEGGRIRTKTEHQKLLEGAGFAVTRFIPTESFITIIEGEKIK